MTASDGSARHKNSQFLDNDTAINQISAAAVGTRYIINTPLVEEAPARINQPVPVPSIYRDGRGEIHNLLVHGQRINLLYTRQGVMRSGDLHPHTQHDFVFSGEVKVSTLASDGRTVERVYGPNQYVAIPPYVPHLFEFTKDSVIAEWWDGPFQAWFYTPYRQKVQQSLNVPKERNKRQLQAVGTFALYRVQEPGLIGTLRSTAINITVGLAVGVMLGIVIGRRR